MYQLKSLFSHVHRLSEGIIVYFHERYFCDKYDTGNYCN